MDLIYLKFKLGAKFYFFLLFDSCSSTPAIRLHPSLVNIYPTIFIIHLGISTTSRTSLIPNQNTLWDESVSTLAVHHHR